MRRRFGWPVLVITLASALTSLGAQTLRPTPPPSATADNEPWYTSGEPIFFAGGVYFPSGATIHFLRNEMVPSGTFGAVPIYTRTTLEPRSVVYVPLAGGLMKPYERRRTGELAGTVGSTSPGFPVVLPADARSQAEIAVQSARVPPDPRADAVSLAVVAETASEQSPMPVATTGTLVPMRTTLKPHLETARRPVGLNAVFLHYRDARWYKAGPAVELVPDRFTMSGEYHGFPVYVETGRPEVIYVASIAGTPGLVTPYQQR